MWSLCCNKNLPSLTCSDQTAPNNPRMSCPSLNILHEDTAAKSLRDSGLVSSAILMDAGTSDDLYQGFNYNLGLKERYVVRRSYVHRL